MKHSLLAVSFLLAAGAFADTYWTGANSTDWSGEGNWYKSGGNWVIGGAEWAKLPDTDPIKITFSKAETIDGGLWVEVGTSKKDVVWAAAEDAEEGAGLTSTWGTANSLTIGTGTRGGLTIESGTYYFPKQMWIGNGNGVDSYLTLNGGSFTLGSYTCVGYGGHGQTSTLTVNGGTYTQKNDNFIVGQGKHVDRVGIFNQTGGTVTAPKDVYLAENAGKGVMNISGGTFTANGAMSAPRGGSTTGEINLRGGTFTNKGDFRLAYGASSTGSFLIDGGDFKASNFFYAGYGQGSTATIDMKSGTFDTDNELVLGTATGANVEMTLSGGTFTPKKFWVGSHYSHSSGGLTAKFSMTGGTLTTDNDQDIVVGGNANAVGLFEMKGGTVNCGKKFQVAWRGTGTLKMSGGDIFLPAGQELTLCSDAGVSATVELTGGTVHTDSILLSTREGVEQSLRVDGGALASVSAKSDWLDGASIPVGANGIGINTDAGATCCATLVPETEGTLVKVLVSGTTVPALSETTDAVVGSYEIPADGRFVISRGASVTFPKPLSIAEGGRIVADLTDVTANGTYELFTITGLADGTTLSEANLGVINLPGTADVTYSVAEGGVVTATIANLDSIVWGADNAEWTAEGVWVSSRTGESVAIDETDEVNFKVVADNTVNTVLVNDKVRQASVKIDVTGENSYQLIKGHGTFAPQALSVKGTIGLAGDEEGPLNLNVKLEETKEGDVSLSKALFAEGVVNLLTSLHMDSINNATLARTSDWQPSYRMTGSGDVVLSNATLTVSALDRFGGYEGSLTLAEGAILAYDLPLHENSTMFGLGPNVKVRMAGGRISRFGRGGGSNNEAIKDLEIVEGTISSISNLESRGGKGCNVDIAGAVTGSGTLSISSGDRRVKFIDDFTNFSGRMNLAGTSYWFDAGIKGGTFDLAAGTVVQAGALPVDNATLILRNTNPNVDYQIGEKATLGTTSATTAHSVSFAEGAKLEFVDDGALTNPKADYVALTMTNPIAGPLPVIANANAETPRGKWKLFQVANKKTVTDEETGVESEVTESYSLVAEFRPKGFAIILQ